MKCTDSNLKPTISTAYGTSVIDINYVAARPGIILPSPPFFREPTSFPFPPPCNPTPSWDSVNLDFSLWLNPTWLLWDQTRLVFTPLSLVSDLNTHFSSFSGDFLLHVYVHERDIIGSPFKIKAIASQADPQFCYVDEFLEEEESFAIKVQQECLWHVKLHDHKELPATGQFLPPLTSCLSLGVISGHQPESSSMVGNTLHPMLAGKHGVDDWFPPPSLFFFKRVLHPTAVRAFPHLIPHGNTPSSEYVMYAQSPLVPGRHDTTRTWRHLAVWFLLTMRV